jgi:hypothetical protein
MAVLTLVLNECRWPKPPTIDPTNDDVVLLSTDVTSDSDSSTTFCIVGLVASAESTELMAPEGIEYRGSNQFELKSKRAMTRMARRSEQ